MSSSPASISSKLRSAPTARRVEVAGLLVPLVVLAWLGWRQRWNSDDAFINFRVVDMIANGHGPVFNAGERVEAYTSTLWLAILWVGSGPLPFRVEWFAVVVGLALSLAGLAAASGGAALLARARGQSGPLVPLGALVFVALPPVWDFATSGLETGLSFAWLGGSFLALAWLLAADPAAVSRRRLAAIAVLCGLGPLVRPDFALFSVAFLVVLIAAFGRPLWPRGAALLAVALASPVLYELFRIGYFASLVPNTAVAKDAGGSEWAQGWRYLKDLAGTTYWLFLPLLAAVAWAVAHARGDRGPGARARTLLVAGTAAAALVHALFVVRVGGDFMHGRLLLPALFALLMPVAVVRVERRVLPIAAAAAVAIWAVVAGTSLRVPYGDLGTDLGDRVIADERDWYTSWAKHAHPVTLDDYMRLDWAPAGLEARGRAEAGQRVVTFDRRVNYDYEDERVLPPELPPRPDLAVAFVAGASNVGLFAYAAGPRVFVADRLGLADPVAARVELRPLYVRPGHRKVLPPSFVAGRFGDPGAVAANPRWSAAREAVTCDGPLRDRLKAVNEPLSAGRVIRNFGIALTGGGIEVPADPATAARELCDR